MQMFKKALVVTAMAVSSFGIVAAGTAGTAHAKPKECREDILAVAHHLYSVGDALYGQGQIAEADRWYAMGDMALATSGC